jgi:hypothetical protein
LLAAHVDSGQPGLIAIVFECQPAGHIRSTR